MKAEIKIKRNEIQTIKNSISKKYKLDSTIISNQILQEIFL